MACSLRLAWPILLVIKFVCSQGRSNFYTNACSQSPSDANHSEAFAEFVSKHGHKYKPGSREYETRYKLFSARMQSVARQNCKPGRSWHAGINKLADRTEQELRAMLGWRKHSRPSSTMSGIQGGEAFLEVASPTMTHRRLTFMQREINMPRNVSWKHLAAMKDVKDQGMCGSCWAVSAATVLRAHSEIYRQDRTFSVQQLLACTPNPRECGGSGGCDGATAELAMDYVVQHGLATEEEFSYKAMDTPCPESLFQKAGSSASALGLAGFATLPKNKVDPLKRALYMKGPVAVSVAADYQWFIYNSGILDSCDKDRPIVNHAVVAVGYGVNEEGMKYWEIQNSWGSQWGEKGFIRLRRRPEEEKEWCGYDDDPLVGTACKDENVTQVYVCGMCGILYDAVVPFFTSVPAIQLVAGEARNTTHRRPSGFKSSDIREKVKNFLRGAGSLSVADDLPAVPIM